MEDRIHDKVVVNDVKNDGSLVHLFFDLTKGVWAVCSYLFWPQWGRHKET